MSPAVRWVRPGQHEHKMKISVRFNSRSGMVAAQWRFDPSPELHALG